MHYKVVKKINVVHLAQLSNTCAPHSLRHTLTSPCTAWPLNALTTHISILSHQFYICNSQRVSSVLHNNFIVKIPTPNIKNVAKESNVDLLIKPPELMCMCRDMTENPKLFTHICTEYV